ncbi:MAG: membrane fusion protein (multidrug efflux system) [Cognaticolwellia sp.]
MNTRSLWLAVPLLVLAGCGSESTPQANASIGASELPEAPGTRVEVAVLKDSEAQLAVELPATVAARSDAMLAVPSGGFVEGVDINVGDRVSKGKTLARIDSATRRYQLEIADAQAEQAEAEWARIQQLGDAVSKQQALNVETQAKVARANASMARLQLSRSVVKSPFTGQVVEVFVEAGEVAGPGTPVVRVVQTDRVTLELSVSGQDITQIVPGQVVRFRGQSLPGTFSGTISNISAAADPLTRTFKVEVDVPNPDGILLPGMLGRVNFERELSGSAITLPQDWLITRLDSTGVFVEQDGVAVWKEVEVALFARNQAVISSGLSAGDRVVSEGGRDLAEGDPLLVVRSGTCCSNGRIQY